MSVNVIKERTQNFVIDGNRHRIPQSPDQYLHQNKREITSYCVPPNVMT